MPYMSAVWPTYWTLLGEDFVKGEFYEDSDIFVNNIKNINSLKKVSPHL